MDGWRRGVPIHSHMTLLIPQVGSVSGSLLHTTRAEPRGPRDDGVLLRLCARLLPAAPGGTERRNEKNRHTDILIRINKVKSRTHSPPELPRVPAVSLLSPHLRDNRESTQVED